MIVFGLSGKAGSGKDTLAENLIKNHGFFRLSFGDGLKEHCRTVHIWDGQKDEAGRRLLQTEGTDKHRASYPNVWIDILVNKMRMLLADGYDRFVITDVRFENEWELVHSGIKNLEWGKDATTKNIRIIGRKMEMSEEAMNHPSETALDDFDFDFYVENTGTIEELDEKTNKIIENL
jgi:hypothetical protein